MADFLIWRDEWRTGIDWIDADHRQIAELLNQLVEVNACAARVPYPRCPDAAKDECLATLDALIERTRRHFQAEEAYLREICFPGYGDHCREHGLQIAEFTDMRRTLGQDGSPVLGPDILDEFKRWFFNHVMSEDRAYVDYHHQVAGRSPPPGANAAADC